MDARSELLALAVQRARVDFEAILAREGLAPIDSGNMVSSGTRPHFDEAAARERYLAWAQAAIDATPAHLTEQRADTRAPLRAVWFLHAFEGKSNGEIAAWLKCSRGAVQKAIRRVLVTAPPQPLVNPWRRSGRDGAETKLRLVPRERNDMPKDETKPAAPAWTRFAVIYMKGTETVRVPGGRDREVFYDVDARYTPLGMDVKLEDKGYAPLADEDGKITASVRNTAIPGADLVIGIPAYKIAQAERVVEGGR